MYDVVYEDGEKEHFFNDVHSHKDKFNPSEIRKKSEPATSNSTMKKPIKLKKKKGMRQKYCTRQWKRRKKETNVVAVNQILNLFYI